MRNWIIATCLALTLFRATPVADGPLIDSMDAISFSAPKEKGRIELVSGRVGNALKFSFDEDCKGVFASGRAPGGPEWDRAAGFSFWVKGDGSDHLGGIELIWNGDYATRYATAFPIDSTDWKKVVVPWRDLIPELGKTTQTIDAAGGNAPSKLGPVQFGKWWYWRDYGANSYSVDEIRLETSIAPDVNLYRPVGNPLARVLAKLKAGRPITMVTMGDSLTDIGHWTNREHNWPAALKARIKQTYGSDVTIINPAMGGTELRQNLIVMPRWTRKTPAPDLVTILFGFNDWSSGMRGPAFSAAQQDAVERIRRATGGRADVLILTCCPTLENGDALGEMAAGCREAARLKNAGLCEIYRAFQAVPQSDKAALYATDKVHLALKGQELVADSVLNSMEKAGR